MFNISIDAHGGDYGLDVTIPAVIEALKSFNDIFIILVGDSEKITTKLAQYNIHSKYKKRYSIKHASQSIAMDESLVSALRNKKDSSMRVAIKLVKDKKAHSCVSSGNSAALMAISKTILKTIPGISRPAMMARLPTTKGVYTHMLDLGANVDSKPAVLLEFAIMGSIVVASIKGITNPSVGLLNIGSEEIKGKQIIKDSAELLKNSKLNYSGYIEADEIYSGAVDVVVCDGFDGNLVLKASEGVASMFKSYLKKSFSKNLYAKIIAMLSYPVLKYFKSSLDHRTYNGATLLGLNGVVIKSHGGADAFSFFYAIKEARIEAKANIIDEIKQKYSGNLNL